MFVEIRDKEKECKGVSACVSTFDKYLNLQSRVSSDAFLMCRNGCAHWRLRACARALSCHLLFSTRLYDFVALVSSVNMRVYDRVRVRGHVRVLTLAA